MDQNQGFSFTQLLLFTLIILIVLRITSYLYGNPTYIIKIKQIISSKIKFSSIKKKTLRLGFSSPSTNDNSGVGSDSDERSHMSFEELKSEIFDILHSQNDKFNDLKRRNDEFQGILSKNNAKIEYV